MGEPVARQAGPGNVVDLVGKIAQDMLVVDQTGLLLAGRAEPDQSHDIFSFQVGRMPQDIEPIHRGRRLRPTFGDRSPFR